MPNKSLLNELTALFLYPFIQKYLLNGYHVLGTKIKMHAVVMGALYRTSTAIENERWVPTLT